MCTLSIASDCAFVLPFFGYRSGLDTVLSTVHVGMERCAHAWTHNTPTRRYLSGMPPHNRGHTAWRRWLPVTFSVYSAALGTQAVVFSKALASLLRATLSGNSQLGEWYTWVALLLFILFAVFWVNRFNLGEGGGWRALHCPLGCLNTAETVSAF